MVDFAEATRFLSPALAKSTDLVIQRGEGSYIWDTEGRRYLDWVQGIAVNALGHCHPRVVAAVQEQAAELLTASFNMVNYPTTLELAERLAHVAPGDLESIFFSNGGAEATDGALKLARVYTHRPAVIAFQGSFHGRTVGATSVTGSNSKYRKWVEPLMGAVYFATYPTRDQCPAGLDEEGRTDYALEQLQRLFDYLVAPETVAAIIMEPIQGEGGYVVPTTRFLQTIRDICDQHGILLIFDEIQAGYGRTGKMFASENFGVVPDIMTLGKALAGGLPMSAIVSTQAIMAEWHAGMHGGTFGGNPLAAAAGLAVLDEFESARILDNVLTQGAHLRGRLEELQERHPIVADVRGLGLMQAIEVDHTDGRPGGDLLEKVRRDCLDHGLLTLGCGVKANGLRVATRLNVTAGEIDEGIEILDVALTRADALDQA